MKKMRKLIPAIALLLVSAVMLSTATFAWFTMNEQVTATGMQVKAKASGNLLVSENKMTAADQAITVALKSKSTNTDVVPVTYDGGWKVPADSTAVDPLYGGLTSNAGLKGADKSIAYTNSPYFIDYTVYIATAGDEMTTQNLYVIMNMVSAAEDIANAYSIAFFVGEPTGNADLGTFAGYVNYDTFAKAAGTKVYLNGTYTIPSTFEKNADNAQGLRITMRVFVDGGLKYAEQVATQVPDYVERTANETYGDLKDSGLKFYKEDASGNKILQDMNQVTDATTLENYYTWNGTTMKDGAKTDKYYVNNNDIPTGATSFDVTIGSAATLPTGAVSAKGVSAS